VAKGAAKADIVERALEVLPSIARLVTQIDSDKFVRSLAHGTSTGPIRAAVEHHLLASDGVLFLLIDDTDQIAAPDEPGHLNRVWAFLLAVRRLTQEIPRMQRL
jgi:hypothetical protein